MATSPDPETGLRAFEVPLAYVSRDAFSQPIFACNNLAGAQPRLAAKVDAKKEPLKFV